MPLVYQYEHPDYGWITYVSLPDLMVAVEADIESLSWAGEVINLEIKCVDMTQDQLDQLPILEDI